MKSNLPKTAETPRTWTLIDDILGKTKPSKKKPSSFPQRLKVG